MERIVKLLEGGNTRKAAALCAGVDQSTFCDWLNRYSEFAQQVEEAEGRAEASLVGSLRSLAEEDRLAAQFLLERRFHQDWRERKEQQVRVEIDDPLETLESEWTRAATQRTVSLVATEPDTGTTTLAGA